MRFNALTAALLIGLVSTVALFYTISKYVMTALLSFLVMAQ